MKSKGFNPIRTKIYKLVDINNAEHVVNIAPREFTTYGGDNFVIYNDGGHTYFRVTSEYPVSAAMAQKSDGILENKRGYGLEYVEDILSDDDRDLFESMWDDFVFNDPDLYGTLVPDFSTLWYNQGFMQDDCCQMECSVTDSEDGKRYCAYADSDGNIQLYRI